MTNTERKQLAAAQAREALQLVRYFAHRAAEEKRNHKAGRHADIAFGTYLGFRSAAWLAAQHFKRHDLFPKP